VTQCSQVEVHRGFGKTHCLHLQRQRVNQRSRKAVVAVYLLVVSCLAYSSTLMMEDVRSSESSVNFYQSTRSHIPEIVFFMVIGVRILNTAQ
jgi:hypothetical protein